MPNPPPGLGSPAGRLGRPRENGYRIHDSPLPRPVLALRQSLGIMAFRGVRRLRGSLVTTFHQPFEQRQRRGHCVQAMARRDGWPDEDVFLDLDDIGAGERWKEALRKANARCEAIILLASPEALVLSPNVLPKCARPRTTARKSLSSCCATSRSRITVSIRTGNGRSSTLPRRRSRHIEIVDFRGETREVASTPAGSRASKTTSFKCGITPDRFAWPPRDRPECRAVSRPERLHAKKTPGSSLAATPTSCAGSTSCGSCAATAARDFSSSRRLRAPASPPFCAPVCGRGSDAIPISRRSPSFARRKAF